MVGRWEDLDTDCLVMVFQKLGIKALVSSVPSVCKSWYGATLNPDCWKSLNFCVGMPSLNLDLVKFVVDRSRGNAEEVTLSNGCSLEAIDYISEKCPGVKFLKISGLDGIPRTLQVIDRWNDLQIIWLNVGRRSSKFFREVLVQISATCKNLVGLCITDHGISSKTALAIVELLPKIKYLALHENVDCENLELVLKCCKDLETFEFRFCKGCEDTNIDPWNIKILNKYSHVQILQSVEDEKLSYRSLF